MSDRSKYTPMMQQYLSIKDEHPDTLLFFRLGDFYELFFDDALKASKLLEITLTSRASSDDEPIPMCGVPYHAAHTYIQKIIDAGEKVAIAEQTSEPTKGAGLVTREVIKIITPGTSVQEGMFEADTNSYVVALMENNGRYALCYGDISIGKYFYMENIENMYEVYDLLRIIAPVEIVVLTSQIDTFEKVIQTIGVPVGKVDEIQLTDNDEIPAAAEEVFSLLENYLLSVRKDSMGSFQDISVISYEQSMYMSAATVSSLEIFETTKNRSKEGSLLSLLDETKSALGARTLRNWLAKPLLNGETIRLRQDVVAFLMDNYVERLALQKTLGKIYDLERLISRVSAGTAATRELHQLKQTMLSFEDLKEVFATTMVHPEIIRQISELKDTSFVRDELIRALATEDVTTLKETGLFNKGYSKELDELQELAHGGTQWLLDLEMRERERTQIKNLRIKYNKVFGYFIEISKGNVPLVQEEWGYERKQTLTNAERYITEELKQKEEQILSANERLSQLEQQLFTELCEKIIPYRAALQQLADFIGWIDVMQAFAQVSQAYRYVRPELNTTQIVDLKSSRHPVIEKVVGEHFIANDVYMDKDNILLITGPNMSGKSTYMRQVAICALMHQIGCFVPAEKASLPIFDALYTRIGAQDDLFSGESTFMVEMNEVSQALSNATNKSLLLFDEIGRGTATYDGLALAYAILKYIDETIHAKTLFSTHYHELTEFANEMDGVRNVHVSATLHGDTIAFHHKVVEGSIERSYGVQVARLAHLPEDVIDEAKRVLLVLESNHQALDEGMVKREHVDRVVFLQNQIEAAKIQELQLQEQLEQIKKIDINDLSPRDAWDFIEKMQKEIK